MKKLNLLALFLVVLVGGFIQCSSMGSMGGMDKVSLCKKGCESNYNTCKDEAKGDTKKVVACEAKKAACEKGCEESK